MGINVITKILIIIVRRKGWKNSFILVKYENKMEKNFYFMIED